MIKLFNANDTNFTSNGVVVITGARSFVHKEDNGDYSLELEAGLDYADYIKENNIIVADTPTGEQPFRIKVAEATRTKIKVSALHAYYDSDNYLIADSYVVNKNCNDALDHLNNATDTDSPFTTSSDIATINSFRCVRQSLNEAITTVLERWGGHLVRDGYNIAIRQNIGADNGIVIQYAKNLKEITVNYNWSDVCTKLLPVGKDGFTLDSLYLYSERQYDTPFTKTVSFEQDIEEENYPDTESYINALRDDLTAQGLAYLESSQYPQVNYTLSANLEKITDIGDVIRVFDERLGVEILTNVKSFTYDCILGKYTEVQFGTIQAGLSDLLKGVNNTITKEVNISAQATQAQVTQALTESEQKILGILGNSYVIYDGSQILVLDSIPANTAHNVIRINSQGIAFSNTGVSGHFTSAWQIDGTFNAQAINIINLTADMLKGGTLKLGSNLNQRGLIEIYDEANNLIATLDNNGLRMTADNGSYIVINATDGFSGYDKNDNRIFWVNDDEFYMKKSTVEQEITLCNKMRFIPIERYDANNNLINDGIGLVSVY